jgi:hypothetical protein
MAAITCFDGSGQGAQISLRRQVGEIVFLLSRHPVFAHEPNLLPRQMLLTFVPDPLRRSVGDPHAPCGRASLELAFRAGAAPRSTEANAFDQPRAPRQNRAQREDALVGGLIDSERTVIGESGSARCGEQ